FVGLHPPRDGIEDARAVEEQRHLGAMQRVHEPRTLRQQCEPPSFEAAIGCTGGVGCERSTVPAVAANTSSTTSEPLMQAAPTPTAACSGSRMLARCPSEFINEMCAVPASIALPPLPLKRSSPTSTNRPGAAGKIRPRFWCSKRPDEPR